MIRIGYKCESTVHPYKRVFYAFYVDPTSRNVNGLYLLDGFPADMSIRALRKVHGRFRPITRSYPPITVRTHTDRCKG
jgi:hypothetical protein